MRLDTSGRFCKLLVFGALPALIPIFLIVHKHERAILKYSNKIGNSFCYMCTNKCASYDSTNFTKCSHSGDWSNFSATLMLADMYLQVLTNRTDFLSMSRRTSLPRETRCEAGADLEEPVTVDNSTGLAHYL